MGKVQLLEVAILAEVPLAGVELVIYGLGAFVLLRHVYFKFGRPRRSRNYQRKYR